MAGLPDGYTIDAPTAPSGQSGLPDGYTIDTPVQGGVLGLKTRTETPAKLLGPMVPMESDSGSVEAYYKDANGKLQPTNNTKHMVSEGKVYEKTDGLAPTTGGDLAQAGLDIAKSVPILGSAVALPQAAGDFWSGKPGAEAHMSDVLSGLTGPGQIAKPSTRGLTTATSIPAKVLSTEGQATHDAIADAIKAAKSSGNVRAAVRKSFGEMKNDDGVMSSLSPEQQAHVGTLADTPLKKPIGETSDLALLALEGVMPPGLHGVPSGLLASRAALRKFSNNRGDKSALSSAEKLRQSVIDNDPGATAPAPTPAVSNPTGPSVPPPPTPWGPIPPELPAPPALPDPQQLKLQMDAFVNQRKALAAAQPAPVPTPPPAPPPINPNALPTSITTPAKNIMGGLANVQEMQAAANPLAKYDAAVQANAARDRSTNSALRQDATGLMAARKAAQAAEEANAEPVSTPATPVINKISKKNGAVKETTAQPDIPAPEPPLQPDIPPELPQSDYSHLPLTAAAHLITQKAFAKGKQIGVTHEEYASGVLDKLRAKESIADQMAEAMPAQEHQDINAHLQGAKTKAQALDVMNHYIKLHPEAEPAIRLAMAKKRLNAGWAR